LLQKYGKLVATESLFNHRDIALQARLDSGELVGFLWVGLMAKGTLGYIDKFCVDPAYAGKGVGTALAMGMKEELVKRKVKTVFGLIQQDEYHEKSAMNALKSAMGAHKLPYTFVEADVAHAVEELKSIGR
jgi:GNAT superfamily N-acetyltransferase